MKIPSLINLATALTIVTASGAAAAACNVRPGFASANHKTVVGSAMHDSSAVFTAQVTAIEYVPADAQQANGRKFQTVKLSTGTWWKGTPSEQVTLHTMIPRDADGTDYIVSTEYQYEVGKSYLIYATTAGNRLYASGCTRTRKLGAASADIAELDALKSEAN
ncbi:hypothetical protein J2X54_000979 [Duganella sp. 3397]|uniref:hypothetical protein n=1 Tax=Duganella sp. 3397 TaxID=2817732 RepID=UPI0028590F9B|nr:hypothetical protein [Duganella sp. 3397]MDR7048531.1 hypothetical protein [Duganella sp. 3397]